jgi:hypothetical protein
MPVWLLVIISRSTPHPASCRHYPTFNAVEISSPAQATQVSTALSCKLHEGGQTLCVL